MDSTPAAKKSFAGIVGMRAKHLALRFNPNPELPLAPFVSAFNLISCLGSLTGNSFCSPWFFTV